MRMAVLAAAAGAALLGVVPVAAQPVEVMVLGTYHFGNPGRDLHNASVDDVTAPARQAELQALADALATFRPTKIMIERQPKTADLIDPDYAGFSVDQLGTVRSERVQIGYRLAGQLGLRHVYGIDEQPGAGEADYFPFDKVTDYAKANRRDAELAALMAEGDADAKAFEARQRSASIAELLIDHNDPARLQSSQAVYYDILKFGGTDRQPGADLNAMWYLRNAKIFGKLMTLAEPGDRILVIYGAGHNYWLRHFAGETRGYRNVDPRPYLRRAIR